MGNRIHLSLRASLSFTYYLFEPEPVVQVSVTLRTSLTLNCVATPGEESDDSEEVGDAIALGCATLLLIAMPSTRTSLPMYPLSRKVSPCS